jgi:hypothetical protein
MHLSRLKIPVILFWAVSILFFNCNTAGKDNNPEEETSYDGPAKFEKIDAKQSGISFFTEIKEDQALNYLTFNYLYLGSPVGVADFNRDGLQDLYFVSTKGENKLYLNKGGFRFMDMTSASGTSAMQGIKTGIAIVDINQDGWPDIYQCRSSRSPSERGNLLFINNKDMTFTESAADYGLSTGCSSNTANFFDFDLDGDLDMYLVNHPEDFTQVSNVRVTKVGNTFKHTNKVDNEFVSDRLYRNDGNGKFTDISKQAGIQKQAFGFSAVVMDFNTDGYPDIYVCNDYIEPDNLFINNRNGTFTDRIDTYMRHTCHFSMGADIADMNNDGLLDLMVVDMNPESVKRQKILATAMENGRYNSLVGYGYGHQFMRNTLQINNGNNTFSEIGCMAGVANTDWSWAPLAVDFDNDGFRDLFISNGQRRDVTNLDYINFTLDSVIKSGKDVADAVTHLNQIPTTEIHNYMFRNKGDLTFEDASAKWGFSEKSISNSAVYADLDNDGDLDLIVSNSNKPSFIYQNKTRESNEGNYLQIILQGSEQNKGGIGTLVRITANDQQQMADANPSRGFLSSSEAILHFGIGKATEVDHLKVQWPDGKVQNLDHIPANQRITLKYSDAQKGTPITQPAKAATLFSDYSNQYGAIFRHKENEYHDFDRERLLPHQFSDRGPGIAQGDINGDGLEDFYIGGAFRSSGALMVQDKSNHFKMITAPFSKDTSYEDTEALMFDADGDKDLDLYIGSGGNELPAGVPNYQDRLYENDGKGNMTVSIGALPMETESAGAVAVNDYDHDGDLDIFVGNRCTPGQYPKTPLSFILKNDHARFQEVTNQVAPDFAHAGMVTDIIFSDLDKDGWDDMLVTGEWMPIKIFKNNHGTFLENTSNAGLSGSNGWWNCIAAADMDGDGDIDLVAGNTGLNTRFRASADVPVKMYAKDFDNNGSMDPIIVSSEKGKYYPVNTRDVMIKQLPGLRKQFPRYAGYSEAAIEDFFPEAILKEAQLFTVHQLQSCYFENQNGRFVTHALPLAAQSAPVQAVIIADFDKNGTKDILVAGNDYGIEVETARYDAGNGLLLLNDGQCHFTPVQGAQSGFWASKDVRNIHQIQLANGKKSVVVANNNDALQIFSY